MPRKIRAKTEEKIDETKVMNILDALPVKVLEPVILKLLLKSNQNNRKNRNNQRNQRNRKNKKNLKSKNNGHLMHG